MRDEQSASLLARLAVLPREERQRILAAAAQGEPKAPAARPHEWPLSFEQESVWLATQLDSSKSAFTVVAAWHVSGNPDLDRLEAALNTVVNEHDSLSARLTEDGGVPRWRRAAQTIPLEVWPAHEDPARFLRTVAVLPLDVTEGPLLRLLCSPTQSGIAIVLLVHHIVLDAFSLATLVREWAAGYRGDRVPTPRSSYAAYAIAQRMSADLWKTREARWTKVLSDSDWDSGISAIGRPRRSSRLVHVSGFTVRGRLWHSVLEAAHRSRTTPFVVMLAAYHVCLQNLTAARPVIAVPVSSGPVTADRPLGLMLSMLPIVVDVARGANFDDVVRASSHSLGAAIENQPLPMSGVYRTLRQRTGVKRERLWRFSINLVPHSEISLDIGLPSQAITPDNFAPKFDLGLYMSQSGKGYSCRLVADASTIGPRDARRLNANFRQVLAEVLAAPSMPTPCARSGRLTGLRAMRGSAGRIEELIFSSGGRAPGAVAVAHSNRTVCYGALVDAVKDKAAGLPIEPAQVCAVQSPRSVELVEWMLAVLAAHGAFLILEPDAPQRLAEVLVEASRARLHIRPQAEVPVVDHGADMPPACASFPSARADQVAYVARTSGTTGIPRLVVGTHRGILNFLAWSVRTFRFDASDRFSSVAGVSHDPLLREILTPLALGATCCLPQSSERFDPCSVAAWLRDERVSVVHLTRLHARLLAECGTIVPRVRWVFLGADRSTGRDLRAVRSVFPGADVVNYYGCVETPQAAAFYAVPRHRRLEDEEAIPVGRGICGVDVRVVNECGRPALPLEPGEIEVRSPLLTLGYMGEGGAGRFGRSSGVRSFRTGDRGHYDAGGAIVVDGRSDHLVKVAATLVNPADTESALRQLPIVKDAGVGVAKVGGETHLAAAVVAATEGAAAADVLARLRELLPAPSVPTYVSVMERIPLTPNGKLDVEAIVQSAAYPPFARGAAPEAYAAEAVATLVLSGWRSVLGRSSIGMDENFFEAGGTSLLLLRLRDHLRSQGHEIELSELFMYPTPRSLAERVGRPLRGQGKFPGAPSSRRSALAELRSKR